jgi:acetylornithine deacetylase/succinyl-diaminopimelate desuccinylase-like protein
MKSAGSAAPDPSAIERLSQVVETNILLRTTCTLTEIAGGHAENALPQRVQATLQCRVIPGDSLDGVRDQIVARLADPAVEVGVRTQGTPSPESPPSPRIVGMVENIVHAIWPGVIVLPQMSPGATDSKFTRSAGIPSYGIDGMFDDLDDGRAHGRDERIGVQAFAEEVEFTGKLLRAVSAK